VVNTNGEPEAASLVIRFEGEAVADHRLPLSDLVDFGRQLQTAVHRVALVLLGNANSVHPGRRHADIERATALNVVAVPPGSFDLQLEQAPQAPSTLFNIGKDALLALVTGLPVVAAGTDALPRGYDRGVLVAVRGAGRLLGRGIDLVEFNLRADAAVHESKLTAPTLQVITRRLKQKTESLRTIDGQLLMGDFKPTGLRCRIHPPLMRPITCTFKPEQRDKVLGALTKYVRVVAEASETEGVITSLTIHDLKILGSAEPYLPAIEAVEQLSAGWEEEPASLTTVAFTPGIAERTDLRALAAQRRIGPVRSFAQLRGDYWPESEDVDEFVDAVRRWRGEGARPA
jgi:hypothetical protein